MNQLVEQVRHWRRICKGTIISFLITSIPFILAFVLSSIDLFIISLYLFGSTGLLCIITLALKTHAENKLDESDKLLGAFFGIFPIERIQDEVIKCLYQVLDRQQRTCKEMRIMVDKALDIATLPS